MCGAHLVDLSLNTGLFLACILLIHSRYCQALVQQQQEETRPVSPAAARSNVIHSLETKLETDLKRVEKDAAKATATKQDHHGHYGNHTNDISPKNRTRLDKDLTRVRTDVRHLVRAIEAAETELERLKRQMAVEQLELKHEKSKMTTEKILDQLHAGKLGFKVDYVTGELVRTNKGAPANLRGANNNSGGICRW